MMNYSSIPENTGALRRWKIGEVDSGEATCKMRVNEELRLQVRQRSIRKRARRVTPLPPRHLHQPRLRLPSVTGWSWGRRYSRQRVTYVIAGLLRLIALLVCLGLGLIRLTLLGRESFPSLSELFTDLAYQMIVVSTVAPRTTNCRLIPKLMPGFSSLTLSRCSLAKNI